MSIHRNLLKMCVNWLQVEEGWRRCYSDKCITTLLKCDAIGSDGRPARTKRRDMNNSGGRQRDRVGVTDPNFPNEGGGQGIRQIDHGRLNTRMAAGTGGGIIYNNLANGLNHEYPVAQTQMNGSLPDAG
jgi:hypothetical protein